MRFGLPENVILKSAVPAHGLVCSNPARAQRVAEHLLGESRQLCDQWGFSVSSGYTVDNLECFVAAVPMGAGGSGFAFHELFAAGAHYVIRYGSSDRQITMEQLRDVLLIDAADNLYGLMRDAGYREDQCGGLLPASAELLEAVCSAAGTHGLTLKRRICHHLEDYHAANYPECGNRQAIVASMPWLADQDDSSWNSDMESAALFFRAQQWGRHAASVLQPLLKTRGATTPYDGDHAEISRQMEGTISAMLGTALRLCELNLG